MNSKTPITPQMKVAELLKEYPELEPILLGLSPKFEKLKNPVLRATVAKMASLKQAADVAGLPIGDLIKQLRSAVGFEDLPLSMPAEAQQDAQSAFDVSAPAVTFDARPILAKGEEPLSQLLSALAKLQGAEVLKLITPFVPAPLIDLAKSRGFRAFSQNSQDDVFTYFQKNP